MVTYRSPFLYRKATVAYLWKVPIPIPLQSHLLWLPQQGPVLPGNLLRGIDIWSGAADKAQISPFDNSFSNFSSLCQFLQKFQLLQTMLAKYGFHSENNFL